MGELNSFKHPYSTSEIVSWSILCPCIETDHDQTITSRFSQGSPYKENVTAYKCERVKAHRHLHGSTRRLGYTLIHSIRTQYALVNISKI